MCATKNKNFVIAGKGEERLNLLCSSRSALVAQGVPFKNYYMFYVHIK